MTWLSSFLVQMYIGYIKCPAAMLPGSPISCSSPKFLAEQHGLSSIHATSTYLRFTLHFHLLPCSQPALSFNSATTTPLYFPPSSCLGLQVPLPPCSLLPSHCSMNKFKIDSQFPSSTPRYATAPVCLPWSHNPCTFMVLKYLCSLLKARRAYNPESQAPSCKERLE